MDSVPVLRGSSGLNNKFDPVKLRYDSETGIQELAVAKDVDIEDSGRISRRKGYSQVLSLSDCHSIYNAGSYCIFVHGDALATLESDYSYSNIRNVTVGARVSYAQVGDKVFYCNGYEKGYVQDRTSYAWEVGEYVGPETTKTFSSPPVGHLLELFSGRLYIAVDDVIWYTEPFNYSAVDNARNFMPLESRVRMIKAVKDGLWVSDSKSTFWLSGNSVNDMQHVAVCNYPAIEGTAVTFSDTESDKMVVWTSTQGICIGGPGGQFKNLTRTKLWYPDSTKGAGFVADGKYLCTLQP
jgi:hypothetical protein